LIDSDIDMGACKVFVEILRSVRNDIRVIGEKQADKWPLDMMGKLNIIFYDADVTRKYDFNKIIKIS
jgi:hypothetical protein